MLSLGAPSDQTAGACPISFVLDDPTSAGAALNVVTLAIRPEDLSRQEPSRLTVQQTLGGAWADSFGAGLAQITISGHTGWHRMYGSGLEVANQSGRADGAMRFVQLRDTVFDQWHKRRAAASSAGLDPSKIKLIFSDGLHGTTHIVAPVSFTLRRSRSRPLLAQYQISMVALGSMDDDVLESTIPSIIDGLTKGPLLEAGLKSLAASATKIAGYAGEVTTWVDKAASVPVRSFMQATGALYQAVRDGVGSINGAADQLILIARDASKAGMNIFHSIAAIVNLPSQIRARAMDVAAAYRNAFCALRGALSGAGYYEDYSPLYGASNCSSTAGGRALTQFAGLNTFAQTVTTTTTTAALSTDGRASLGVLASSDPVLAPMSLATIGPLASSAARGISV